MAAVIFFFLGSIFLVILFCWKIDRIFSANFPVSADRTILHPLKGLQVCAPLQCMIKTRCREKICIFTHVSFAPDLTNYYLNYPKNICIATKTLDYLENHP